MRHVVCYTRPEERCQGASVQGKNISLLTSIKIKIMQALNRPFVGRSWHFLFLYQSAPNLEANLHYETLNHIQLPLNQYIKGERMSLLQNFIAEYGVSGKTGSQHELNISKKEIMNKIMEFLLGL